jgi:hypothetical protein
MNQMSEATTATVVLHLGEQYRGSEKLVVENGLCGQPGVIQAEARPGAADRHGHVRP